MLIKNIVNKYIFLKLCNKNRCKYVCGSKNNQRMSHLSGLRLKKKKQSCFSYTRSFKRAFTPIEKWQNRSCKEKFSRMKFLELDKRDYIYEWQRIF